MEKEQMKKDDTVADSPQQVSDGVPAFGAPQDMKGVYANVAAIRYTEREFIFDFILRIDERAQLVSRVITSPDHARELLEVLRRTFETLDGSEKKA